MSKADFFTKIETVRVEITPGYFIDVNPKAINPDKNRVRMGRTKNTDIIKHRVISDALRGQSKRTKYSSLILDEAVNLWIKKGLKYAVKKTGVKKWSIIQRKRHLTMAGLYKPTRKTMGRPRYTIEQKRKCVSIALQLMQSSETKVIKYVNGKSRISPKWSRRAAFMEAARRLGMNWESMVHMYSHGMIK